MYVSSCYILHLHTYHGINKDHVVGELIGVLAARLGTPGLPDDLDPLRGASRDPHRSTEAVPERVRTDGAPRGKVDQPPPPALQRAHVGPFGSQQRPLGVPGDTAEERRWAEPEKIKK